MTAGLRVSTAVIDVTPPLGFPLGGYILRSGVSVGVLDPILARLILLTSGDDALLLISLDWVYIDGRWARAVRLAVGGETGIDSANIIVTATHTHSGPGVFRSFITAADEEPAYLSGVSGRIVEAAASLTAAAQDVTAAAGSSRVVGLGTHRNDPGLPVDDALSVLTLRDPGKAAVARIVVYGCHGTLLGADNLLFSADWIGYGLAAVDRRMGGMSLFINGAAGDVSTRFTRQDRGSQELRRYAGVFCEAARQAEKGSAPVSGTGIAVLTRHVPVAYRKLPDRDEAQRLLSQIEATINELRSKGIKFTQAVREASWGRITAIALPGGGELGLYQPRHPTALARPDAASRAAPKGARAKTNGAKSTAPRKKAAAGRH